MRERLPKDVYDALCSIYWYARAYMENNGLKPSARDSPLRTVNAWLHENSPASSTLVDAGPAVGQLSLSKRPTRDLHHSQGVTVSEVLAAVDEDEEHAQDGVQPPISFEDITSVETPAYDPNRKK